MRKELFGNLKSLDPFDRQRQELEMLLAETDRLIAEMRTYLERAALLQQEQRDLLGNLLVQRFAFPAICSKGHSTIQHGFTRAELERRIQEKKAIQLHCDACDESWYADPHLTESLRRSLAEA